MSVPLAELLEKNAYSRFRVYEAAVKSPGKCAVCGAHDKPVLDPGINITAYGWVMICFECVSEAGERIGLVRPEVHEAEVLQVGQSVTDYLEANGLKVISNELYNALIMVGTDLHADLLVRPNGLPGLVDDQATAPVQGKLRIVVDDADDTSTKSSNNSEPFDF